jgi:hypothetical protein
MNESGVSMEVQPASVSRMPDRIVSKESARNFSPMLGVQARLLTHNLDRTKPIDKVKIDPSKTHKDRYDWGVLNNISNNERAAHSTGSKEDVMPKWTAWLQAKAQDPATQELIQKLQIDPNSPDKFVNRYFNAQGSNFEQFIGDVLKLGPETNLDAVKSLAGGMFGPQVSAEIIIQITSLENNIKKNLSNLASLEEELNKHITDESLSEDEKKLLDDAKKLQENVPISRQAEVNSPSDSALEKPATPSNVEALIGGKGHPEQQIEGDPHSIGGDYLLTSNDSPGAKELISERGELYIVMDTATTQSDGSTSEASKKTKKFAEAFMNFYYSKDGQFSDPQSQARAAYQEAVASVGSSIESTISYVIKKGTKVFAGGVGNSPVALIGKDNDKKMLVDPTGQSYIDENGNSPTVLIGSGETLRQNESDISPGEYLVMHTDGFKPTDYSIDALKRLTNKETADDAVGLIIQ